MTVLCYLSSEEAQLSVARVTTHTGATTGGVVLSVTATATVSAKEL